mmetsp:Transcript_28025/g.69986  ORF Transcript_28025/g.69986 Transcript_28025/m.69986 type:complete len:321 (+) Transcript_28025:482-1444(+)
MEGLSHKGQPVVGLRLSHAPQLQRPILTQRVLPPPFQRSPCADISGESRPARLLGERLGRLVTVPDEVDDIALEFPGPVDVLHRLSGVLAEGRQVVSDNRLRVGLHLDQPLDIHCTLDLVLQQDAVLCLPPSDDLGEKGVLEGLGTVPVELAVGRRRVGRAAAALPASARPHHLGHLSLVLLEEGHGGPHGAVAVLLLLVIVGGLVVQQEAEAVVLLVEALLDDLRDSVLVDLHREPLARQQVDLLEALGVLLLEEAVGEAMAARQAHGDHVQQPVSCQLPVSPLLNTHRWLQMVSPPPWPQSWHRGRPPGCKKALAGTL